MQESIALIVLSMDPDRKYEMGPKQRTQRSIVQNWGKDIMDKRKYTEIQEQFASQAEFPNIAKGKSVPEKKQKNKHPRIRDRSKGVCAEGALPLAVLWLNYNSGEVRYRLAYTPPKAMSWLWVPCSQMPF